MLYSIEELKNKRKQLKSRDSVEDEVPRWSNNSICQPVEYSKIKKEPKRKTRQSTLTSFNFLRETVESERIKNEPVEIKVHEDNKLKLKKS